MNADLRTHVASHTIEASRRVDAAAGRTYDEALQVGAEYGARWALGAARRELELRAQTLDALERTYRAKPAPTYADIARADAAAFRARELRDAAAVLDTLCRTV